jgi:hypothetical protein
VIAEVWAVDQPWQAGEAARPAALHLDLDRRSVEALLQVEPASPPASRATGVASSSAGRRPGLVGGMVPRRGIHRHG